MATRINQRGGAKPKKRFGGQSGIIIAALALISLLVVGVMTSQDQSQDDPKTGSGSQASGSHYSPIKACHVFIENSGSMDAYVNPANSQLKTDLNALVSAIKSDTLTLNYINSEIIPVKGGKRVSDFFEGLSVSSFRNAGGNRSYSSLRDLFTSIYEHTGAGEVSILVSDMILALASGQAPESVSTNIETDLRNQMKQHPSWSVVVWRMLSDYEGKYYHRNGVPSVKLTGVKRPYYIFFFGDREQLRSLLSEDMLPRNLPLWDNRTDDMSLEPVYTDLPYHLLPQATLGSIELDKRDRHTHTIAQAEVGQNRDGQRGLGFEILLKKRPEVLQSPTSLTDERNYDVSPSAYRVVRVEERGEGLKLRLQTERVVRGPVTISYLQAMPSWLNRVHCEQNDDIHADGAIDQTYGIRYILEGLRRPYETQAQKLMQLSIHIN